MKTENIERCITGNKTWSPFGALAAPICESARAELAALTERLARCEAALREVRDEAHSQGNSTDFGDFVMDIIGLCESALADAPNGESGSRDG